MYKISDAQIDFILNDIKHRGITIEELQENLLDHICCIIERDPEAAKDFDGTYSRVIKTFFKTELCEIEIETVNTLLYKQNIAMKWILYTLLSLSVGYNIFMIVKKTNEHFEMERYIHQTTIVKEANLENEYSALKEKLKASYPGMEIKDFICVSFMGYVPGKEEEQQWNKYTHPSWNKRPLKWKYSEYISLDTYTKNYKDKVTHVFAFQQDHENIKKKMAELKPLLNNSLLLSDMNMLLSAINNKTKKEGGHPALPVTFVLDKKGEIVFYCDRPVLHYKFLTPFLKTLPNK